MSNGIAALLTLRGKSASPDGAKALAQAAKLVEKAEREDEEARFEDACDKGVEAATFQLDVAQTEEKRLRALLTERAQLQTTVQTCTDRHTTFSQSIDTANAKLSDNLVNSAVSNDKLIELSNAVENLVRIRNYTVEVATTAQEHIADIDSQCSQEEYEALTETIAGLTKLTKDRKAAGEAFLTVKHQREQSIDAAKQQAFNAQSRAEEIAANMKMPERRMETAEERMEREEGANSARQSDELFAAQQRHAMYQRGI
jgi:hypothetical protein